MLLFPLFLIFFKFSLISSLMIDAYWRDYDGEIPPDALIAGKNPDGSNFYVGQGYLAKGGIMIGQINANKTEIYVDFSGVTHITQYIKILCGTQSHFSWLLTSGDTLLNDIVGKNPVVGGHEDRLGFKLYVGRGNYEGFDFIGKVVSQGHYVDNIFGVFNGTTRMVIPTYEVLIYNP